MKLTVSLADGRPEEYTIKVGDACRGLKQMFPEVGFEPTKGRDGIVVTYDGKEWTIPHICAENWAGFLHEIAEDEGLRTEVLNHIRRPWGKKALGFERTIAHRGSLSNGEQTMAAAAYVAGMVLVQVLETVPAKGQNKEDIMSKSTPKAAVDKKAAKVAAKMERDHNLMAKLATMASENKKASMHHCKAVMCAAIYWYRRKLPFERSDKKDDPGWKQAFDMHTALLDTLTTSTALRNWDKDKILAEEARREEETFRVHECEDWTRVIRWTGGSIRRTVRTVVLLAKWAWNRTVSLFKKTKKVAEEAVQAAKETVAQPVGEPVCARGSK